MNYIHQIRIGIIFCCLPGKKAQKPLKRSGKRVVPEFCGWVANDLPSGEFHEIPLTVSRW